MATRAAFDLGQLDFDKFVDLDVLGNQVRSEWRKWANKWATEPPFYAAPYGFPVVVTGRWKDVREVALDRDRFSAQPPPGHPFGLYDPVMGMPMLNTTDGESHDRLRRLMQPYFNPDGIAKFEAKIVGLVKELFDAIDGRGGGEFDAMADVAEPAVSRTLCEVLIEVEGERAEEFRQYAHKMPLTLQPTPEGDYHPEFVARVNRTLALIEELLEERRRDPTDDLITAIVRAVDEGFPVTHDEVLGNVLAIYGGAQLATATSVGVMLMNLAANPDQFQLVRKDPTLIPVAVDESLRVQPAGLFGFPRYAFEDTEVGGTKIWENMAIMPGIAAANLDPTRFEKPNRYEIQRDLKGAMPFSVGAHQCIGARVARMVMHSVARETVERYSDLRLADADFEPTYGGVFGELKPDTVPVVTTAA